jgi:hypothetical protein
VVDDDTSPAHPLDPRTVEVTVTPLSKGTPRPQLHSKLADPKGGVVFRYEAVQVGWYRIRLSRRARPGAFTILREATRTVQVVKIQRPVKPSDEHYAVTIKLRQPVPKEKPAPHLFFQVMFMDKNEPDEGIPNLLVRLRLPGRPEAVELQADPGGTIFLMAPDIVPGQADILSIVDDRDGSPIVYDEFARTGLATDVVHVIEMPDKRKVGEKIAAAHKIKRRWDWGARTQKTARMEQDWDYSTVIIHHSGDVGMDDPRDIQRYQMYEAPKRKRSDDIAYEYVVNRDGTITEGRILAYKSAANSNKNTGKIAILIAGDFHPGKDFSADEPTAAQLASTEALIKTLQRHFPLRMLGGHRDIEPADPGEPTDCPGDNLYPRLDSLRAATGLSPLPPTKPSGP